MSEEAGATGETGSESEGEVTCIYKPFIQEFVIVLPNALTCLFGYMANVQISTGASSLAPNENADDEKN
ncbi:hypothetical protein FHW67_000393 [Herbaspirillum sp. Sphag1AN]|uniref:hypothetical protein n=1 Tax=unclassified Herbaspirillum TaxID=2624150 RepID=UPI0016121CEA|nr:MULTISPECIES: hypothetical protein [unclassified Herbaspirillum]MBB3211158.1 hypothetical protein [Herbaspirillum sp. Sphag1AN]MBB3244787.1 hypothetical protein [Herbaspirillum sp. Sphag64]